MTDFNPEAIPQELRERDQWLLFDTSHDTPRRPHWGGDFTISWSDPDDWHSFDDAVELANTRDSWGIGYVFAWSNEDFPRGVFGGLDLDGCVDGRRKADWLPSLEPFWDRDAYAEFSPSGEGIHIPVVGFEPPEWWHNVFRSDEEHEGIEAYGSKFFTFTGDSLDPAGGEIVEAGEWLDDWLKEAYESVTGESPELAAAPTPEPRETTHTREEVEDVETTEDYDVVLDAVEHLRVADLPIQSSKTEDENSSWESWDPGYRSSKTGKSLKRAKNSGKFLDFSEANPSDCTPFDVLDLFAAEHGIKRRPYDDWGDGEFSEACRDAREHGAPIPKYVGGDPEEDTPDEPNPVDLSSDEETVSATVDDLVSDAASEAVAALETWGLDPDAVVQLIGLEAIDHLENVSARVKATAVKELLDASDDFQVRYDAEAERFWGFENGIWKPAGERLLATAARDALARWYYDENVLRKLKAKYAADPTKLIAPDKDLGARGPDDGHEYVAVKNGLLDLDIAADEVASDDPPAPAESDALTPLRWQHMATARLTVDYDPRDRAPRWRQFVDEVVEDDRTAAVQEYVGYALERNRSPAQKALMLVGEGMNGKGTFLDTVEDLLGGRDGENVRSVPPHQFDQLDALAELQGAIANIEGDLSAGELTPQAVGIFKKLTGGDPVRARRLYENGFKFKSDAKHLYAVNEVPDAPVSDGDTAFWRRWLIVEFPRSFVGSDDLDRNLGRKLKRELPGVLNWAIQGRDRLINDGEPWVFTNADGPFETRDRWRSWGDTLEEFVSDCVVPDADAQPVSTGEVFEVFKAWCDANGEVPTRTQRSLTGKLKQQPGLGYSTSVRRRQDGKAGYHGFNSLAFDMDDVDAAEVIDALGDEIGSDPDDPDGGEDDTGSEQSDLRGVGVGADANAGDRPAATDGGVPSSGGDPPPDTDAGG